MRPRYAIIDEYERAKFEKEWQMPYGYSHCFITTEPQEAIQWLENHYRPFKRQDCETVIIEKISEGGYIEFFYRR